jgi:hypothetical protein
MLIPKATSSAWIFLFGYLGSIAIGGVIGILAGSFVAHKLNALIAARKHAN